MLKHLLQRTGGDWLGLLAGAGLKKNVGRNLTQEIGKAIPSLGVNQAINPIRGFYAGAPKTMRTGHGKAGTAFASGGFLGGIPRTVMEMQRGRSFKEAINLAHRGADGNLSLGSIAGSYMTAAAAGRVLSGGGLYKDRHGRTNIVGVPFI